MLRHASSLQLAWHDPLRQAVFEALFGIPGIGAMAGAAALH